MTVLLLIFLFEGGRINSKSMKSSGGQSFRDWFSSHDTVGITEPAHKEEGDFLFEKKDQTW